MGLVDEKYFWSGSYDGCGDYGDQIRVRFVGSCRGSHWDGDFCIPMTIMRSPDPIAAAKKWKVDEDQCKKTLEEEKRKKEIARLENELNELKGK